MSENKKLFTLKENIAVVQRVKKEEKTSSGLHLTSGNSLEQQNRNLCVLVQFDKEYIDFEAEIGDKVIISEGSELSSVMVEGEEYIFVEVSSILAKLKD